MDSSDFDLTSLCKICHTNPPKYTCPCCTLKTCSLPCTKRHKLRSSCSGIRDPTVYLPRSQLATPSGIDHDYNFIAGIERSLSQAEREVIEEKGLIEERSKREERHRRRDGMKKGDVNVYNAIKGTEVMVERAPKGMSRQKENGTNWNKREKALNWQVEWISCVEGLQSGKSKVLEYKPLSEGFEFYKEETRRKGMSTADKKAERKRNDGEGDQGTIKRKRTEEGATEGMGELDVTSLAEQLCLQDPQTSAWDMEAALIPTGPPPPSPYDFYLVKPHTPTKMPKVLIPLDSAQCLKNLLRGQVVLEFPTIYVFLKGEHIGRKGFIDENKYLATRPKGQGGNLVSYESSDEDDDELEESETSSSGSSSEEDSDEEME